MDHDVSNSVPAFDIRDLAYTVGRTAVLSELSVVVHKEEALLIAGQSGSGKSSFLKLLVRLIEPTGGSIRFLGQSIEHMAPPELRRRAVYVPQTPALGPVPVAENLRLGPAFVRCEADQDRIIQLLEMVKLPPEYAARNTRGLSGGEQYRVSLAMALALDPEVLLLDEPTASLDPELADHIGSLIRKLTGDSLAVIVATHDMQLVKGLTGTYLFLDAGRTRASGALSSLDEDADTTALWKRLATPVEEQ